MLSVSIYVGLDYHDETIRGPVPSGRTNLHLAGGTGPTSKTEIHECTLVRSTCLSELSESCFFRMIFRSVGRIRQNRAGGGSVQVSSGVGRIHRRLLRRRRT